MFKKIFLLLFFISTFSYSQEKIEVFFDFDKYELNPDAIAKLNTWMVEKNNIEVTKIYGFCDWKGTRTYNDSLSLRRVNMVYYFLKQNYVDINPRYQLKGFGKDFEQSKIQADNRKVIILFEEKRQANKRPAKTEDSKSLDDQFKNSKPGDMIMLKNINFKNNSAVIIPKSKDVLYDLLCVLEDHPKLKIEIQGHICCRLDGDINDISTSRAKAIYNFLVRNKINRNRLTYKGYGTSVPIYPIPEKSDDEEEANRRVEIMVTAN